jgi:hypothetical protein
MDAAQNMDPTKNNQENKLIPVDRTKKSDTKITVEDDPGLPEKKRQD